jgi:Flp pilus assembly protein TadG
MALNLPLQRLVRRWRDDRRGTAAIEFAFVAGPFLFMIFAVIELALVFLLSTSLDAASEQAARRIRTGQFQTASQTKADFKADICARMTWLAGNCGTALSVDVRTYDTYSQVTPINPIQTAPDGQQSVPDTFPTGPDALPPQRIVVVRTHYTWPLISPLMNQGLTRMNGGVALVSSTQTFVTEPYR